MSPRNLIGILLLTITSGCVGIAGGEEELTRGRSSNELAFAKEVQVGDIILTSSSAERGCWYLNKAENWALDPRYCHAALVVERTGETGITTIEALNPSQGIRVITDREYDLVSDLETKLAVLRVSDNEGKPLKATQLEKVVEKALTWQEARYVEPPISLSGDPMKTGLYCSMLPYRAYLDALRIDLDAVWTGRSITVPFFVTPDEIYEAKNVKVVFESAPQDPPTR